MATRTLTALYDTKDAAEQAQDRLRAAGVTDVDIHNQDAADTLTEGAYAAGAKTRGLLDRIAGLFGGHHEDAHAYAEGVRRGHYLLTVKAGDDTVAAASAALGGAGAVDFDAAQSDWRADGWAPGQRAYDQGASTVGATDQSGAVATPTGAGAATAEDFGEPASTGSQIAPELPAQAAATTAVGVPGLTPGGDAALERVTDSETAPKAARREDERTTPYLRAYVADEDQPSSYFATASGGAGRDETAGEGVLRQDATIRDVFQPKADAAKDLDQGIPRSDISPGGSLNRPA